MTIGPAAALIVLLTLAAVLLVSGVAKLRDTRATRDAFDALRVPAWIPANIAARALPWLEIVVAASLLALPSPWSSVAAVAVLVVMLSYTAVIARALTFDEPVTCSCFGSLGRHDVDRLTLARNVLLSLLAAAASWYALDGGGSSPGALAELDAQGWSVLAAAGAAAVVAVLVAGFRTSSTSGGDVGDNDLLDYERQVIPYGTVALADGSTATMVELARAQARLIVILNPRCSPCVRIAEKVDEWATRLAPAVGVLAVYPSLADMNEQTNHALELAAWEPELNIRRVFGAATPTALLLGVDGMMAGGPVTGEDAVEALVAEVSAELAAAPVD